MSKKSKKWLVSCIVTFVTGFGIVFVSNIDTITLNSFRDGALMGLLFTAIRAGVKALFEWYLANTSKTTLN